MNLSYFISKRISQKQNVGFASTIHKIAVASIGIGLAAAIVAFLVMKGFQETVQNKIYSFSGHLLITKFTMSNSMEEQPVNYHIDVYDHPERFPFIKHIQEYAHKAGMVKTENEVLGVLVKGVGKSFDTRAFEENMVEGRFINFPDSAYSNEVVISRTISNKIRMKVGDQIIIHFFQNPPRFRRLKIVGIYETNLAEYFDSKVIIGDIRMIQRLNDWSDSIAGGLEVFIKEEAYQKSQLFQYSIEEDEEEPGIMRSVGHGLKIFSNYNQQELSLQKSLQDIGETMDYDLNIEQVSDRYLQVFDWLNLLSRQVNILLAIILSVVCVNMISIILILVMERTQMIGMLKALGATDRTVRSIFVLNGISLIFKGLIFGNLLGLGLCFLQYRFQWIKLNPHDYYMNFVPVSWHWEIVVILNLLVFLVVTVVLLLPTMVISRIQPIKAIRFD